MFKRWIVVTVTLKTAPRTAARQHHSSQITAAWLHPCQALLTPNMRAGRSILSSPPLSTDRGREARLRHICSPLTTHVHTLHIPACPILFAVELSVHASLFFFACSSASSPHTAQHDLIPPHSSRYHAPWSHELLNSGFSTLMTSVRCDRPRL